jgi:hypothetical protein
MHRETRNEAVATDDDVVAPGDRPYAGDVTGDDRRPVDEQVCRGGRRRACARGDRDVDRSDRTRRRVHLEGGPVAFTTAPGAGVWPNVTIAPGTNPVPAIVTGVPPATGPLSGVTTASFGAP